jgi:LPS O-antigen subunit length determinant protein (WzzB/FepE family)
MPEVPVMSDQRPSIDLAAATDYQGDLIKVFRILFKRRVLIIGGTCLITALAIVISLVLPKLYRSEGFYLLSEETVRKEKAESEFTPFLTLPEFKSFSRLFADVEIFNAYLKTVKPGPDDLTVLRTKIRNPVDLSQLISPLYAYSREEIREGAPIRPEQANYILGIIISYEDSSPEKARQIVRRLGGYVRNCVIYGRLHNYINSHYSTARVNSRTLENNIISRRFQLDQLMEKRKQIQLIRSKYPQSTQLEERQVVSMEPEGYRYLSPVAQLVGIESKIADIQEEISTFERERKKEAFFFDFFAKLKTFLGTTQTGERVFQELTELLDQVLKTQDLSLDPFKEAFNGLTIDAENHRDFFESCLRFVSDPSLPARAIKPKKLSIVLGAFLISLFVFSVIAFLLEFYRTNRELIVKKDHRPPKPSA